MRSVSSLVAGLVALVAALATVPMLWVSTHLADEDAYVTLSSRLAGDQELQQSFIAYLVDDYVQRGVLPEPLRDVATTALTGVTRETTNQPGFAAAWEQTQRSLHASAFSDDGGPLTVDLAPLAGFVADRVGDVLPVSLEVPADLVMTIGTAEDRERIGRIEQSSTYALLGLMIVLVAATVCLVAARSRPVAVAGLGLAALVTAGVLRVGTEIVTPKLIDGAPGSTAFSQAFQKLLVARASESLTGWLGWIAVAGGAAVLLGLVGRLFAGRPAR